MPLRLILNGAKGRMGQALIAAAPAADAVFARQFDLGAAPDANDFQGADAALDFSAPAATLPFARLAARAGVPLVIGTTGHDRAARKALTTLARKIPVVWAGNYSVGVNVLNFLARQAAQLLGDGYDIEIVEMHHRLKKDAPSGTAEKLLEVVRTARGLPDKAVVHGRHGLVGARPSKEIGVHALRGGDVVGDHTVFFAGDGERLELTHRATNRTLFALGALRAARWLAGRKPGLYGMEDVLGLHPDSQ